MRNRVGRRAGTLIILVLAVVLVVSCTAQYGKAISYSPTIARYLPALAGLDGERRYLILGLDPAELRPIGGYTGTIGIVGVDHGKVVERDFGDVDLLDTKPNVPFVEPPEALQNYLPEMASWDLADAAWSPDFPTAAKQSLKLYTLESGDSRIDGVIALTTYAIDRLLDVIGPVTVPDYGVTVNPGDTTLVSLGLTRGVSSGTYDRKAFFDPLASAILAKMTNLPPWEVPKLQTAFDSISTRRDVMIWLADPSAEAWIAASPLGGSVSQAPGDYVYVVEANVQPPSKYNLVVQRSDAIHVSLDASGEAADSLAMTWENDAAESGTAYESVRQFSSDANGLYGAYVRLLTPQTSALAAVAGQAADPIDAPDETSIETNRNVYGNFLLIAPGTANLGYQWSVPGAATQSQGIWTYDLTIQRQPGASDVPVQLTVALPAGAQLVSVSGAQASGQTVTLDTPLDHDLTIEVRYKLP